MPFFSFKKSTDKKAHFFWWQWHRTQPFFIDISFNNMEEDEARSLHERLKAMLDITSDVGIVANDTQEDDDEDESLKYLHEKLNYLMSTENFETEGSEQEGETGSNKEDGSEEYDEDRANESNRESATSATSDKGGDIDYSDDDINDGRNESENKTGADSHDTSRNNDMMSEAIEIDGDVGDDDDENSKKDSDSGSVSTDSDCNGSYDCFNKDTLDIRDNVEVNV
jgi:hypothetical protein